jgi:N-acetylneuraminic acid mutarotase
LKLIIYISFLFTLLFGYDASAAWIKRADFGSHGRHRGTALSIGTKGYMGLGHYNGAGPNIILSDWWEYDPSTNAWTQKADYIGNNGNGNYGVLALGIGNYGYITGGTTSGSQVYRYDPSLNVWTNIGNCPSAPVNVEGFVVDGKGYYVTGNNLYEFDPATNLWTTKNNPPFSLWIWNSSFSLNGKGYLKSGNSLWEYKPSIDDWTYRAYFPGLSSGGSMSFTQYGKAYIVSGYDGGLSNLNSEVWEYDPMQNSWTQLSDFPGNSRRFACSFEIGDRVYCGIGTNGTNFNDFWEFDRYLDLEEMFDANQFTTFPNPAIDHITFRSENVKSFEVVINDGLGRKLKTLSTTSGSVTFNKENNKTGIYFYQVLTDGKVMYSNKFIFN